MLAVLLIYIFSVYWQCCSNYDAIEVRPLGPVQPAPKTRIRPAKMEKADQWKSFSVSEFHFKDVKSPEWEHYINMGEQSMKVANYLSSASFYRTAAIIAVGPVAGGGFKAFEMALNSWPDSTAGHRLSTTSHVMGKIWLNLINKSFKPVFTQREDGTLAALWPPNKAAGIAMSRASAAFLAAGKAKDALSYAILSTSADPSCIRGRLCEIDALSALGMSKAAEKKMKELVDFEACCDILPAQYLSLMQVQWITMEEAMLIYAPITRRQMLLSLSQELPKDAFGDTGGFTNLFAFLVPFMGCQFLVLHIECMPEYPQKRIDFLLDYVPLDPSNANIVELPPHGRASRRSAEQVPSFILRAVGWVRAAGVRLHAVVCGQGLAYPQAIQAIDNHLTAQGADVLVVASESTSASDMFAQHLADEAARGVPAHQAAAKWHWDPDSVWGAGAGQPGREPPVAPPARGPGIRIKARRLGACRRLAPL